MSGELTAFPDDLANAGRQFHGTAQALQDVVTNLVQALTPLGDFLVRDDPYFGQPMHAKYDGPSEQWFEQTGVGGAQALPNLGDSVITAAQAIDNGIQNDQAAATQFSSGVNDVSTG